jgi:hypothetical protein
MRFKVFEEILLRFAIFVGTTWIKLQRRKHRRQARALLPEERDALSTYFDENTLDSVRIAFASQLTSPVISSLLRIFRLSHLLDMRGAAGITFGEVVLIIRDDRKSSVDFSLLFHELIHVVQYRVLGLHSFMKRYIRGWNENSRAYLLIPLERDAYSLQARFDRGEKFDAEEEAVKRL